MDREYWLWSGAEAFPAKSFAQALHAHLERPASRAATIVCAETEEFRLLARTLPLPGWAALDIGAAHGHATEMLAAAVGATGRVVGVEKGREFIEAARQERPQLTFERLDALAAPQYLVQLAGTGVDIVAIDINGIREISGLLPLIALAERVVAPSVLLVKSRHLWESARAYLSAPESGLSPPGGQPAAAGGCGAVALDGGRRWAFANTDAAELGPAEGPSPGSGCGSSSSSAGWWRQLLAEHRPESPEASGAAGTHQLSRSARRYPLNYPHRFVPGSAGTRICEFHNYDGAGCLNHRKGKCQLDHCHCHFCAEAGHRALECPEQVRVNSLAVDAMIFR